MSDQGNGDHGGDHGNGHDDHGGHHSALADFRKKQRAIDKLVDTIQINHEEAYTKAAKGVLTGDDGLIDYTKLKDDKTVLSMADKMAETYLHHAKEYFKMDDDHKLDENQKELLLSAYAGITKGELQRQIESDRDDFKLDRYRQVMQPIQRRVRERLEPNASSHVTDHDLEHLVEEMGLSDKVDHKFLTLEEARGLMATYHANEGVLPPKAYERLKAAKKEHAEAGAHGH